LKIIAFLHTSQIMDYSRETTHVLDIYNRIARHFDKTRMYHWRWVIDFQNQIQQSNQISNVIDIGCGTGRNMQTKPAEENLKIVGIDNSREMINICREKKLETYESSILSMPFQDDVFDAGMCIAMFHHLETTCRREKALREIKRILKPNAKLLLSVWSIQQPTKTRRKFEHYGDTIVPYYEPNTKEIHKRYYYIFRVPELLELFSRTGFSMDKHWWDCGNEIFILSNMEN
jgi:ubiquinone/menaquinone biosynthesis C-methylase UbiE